MNVVAFAASTSKTSINKQLVTYATGLLTQANVEVLDLNDFELPLFSEDKEKEIGQPQAAKDFLEKLNGADAVVISFAEHNGSYSAAYKNLFDWASRIQQKVYLGKKAVLLATSPGGGGAKTVLSAASSSMPHFGAEVLGSYSLPKFYDHFDGEQKTVSDETLDAQLKTVMATLS